LAHAQKLGLDIPRWTTDKDSATLLKEIEYDTSLASALGLSGTPGLIVNGRVSKGWGSVFGLESTVKMAMKSVDELRSKGVPEDQLAFEATKLADVKIANLLWGIDDEKKEL